MSTAQNTQNPQNISRARRLLTSVRDEIRERRADRAAYRELERELATYTTRTMVDDLLVAVEHSQSRDAERIRGILARNLELQQRNQFVS